MLDKELTEEILSCAFDVHSELGPGLLESAYEACLCYELTEAGFEIEKQKPIPLIYKGVKLDCGYRADIIVENKILIELKSVESLNDIHLAQVITYLKLLNHPFGFLINYNVKSLKEGIKRIYNPTHPLNAEYKKIIS